MKILQDSYRKRRNVKAAQTCRDWNFIRILRHSSNYRHHYIPVYAMSTYYRNNFFPLYDAQTGDYLHLKVRDLKVNKGFAMPDINFRAIICPWVFK